MVLSLPAVLALLVALFCGEAVAFWRMNCGIIQTGRVDAIINPGTVSGHVHTISGPINFNTTSTYDSLQASFCTSCSIQQDKSAYWTPLLYYQFRNGSVIPVPTDGTTVYYLGRGEDRANIIPFPKGFRMLSGDPYLRAYNSSYLTYGDKSHSSRPVSDRVSFNCLNFANGSAPETYYMANTNCPNGLRAQIHFPTCWNGVDLYKSDQSHMAHMSAIDNGICPPTHPKLLPHLFYEVYYFPNRLDQSDGGSFTFASGDKTGYGFHGDFLNGWDIPTLQAGINQCINTVDSGQISDCPPLKASDDTNAYQNCPEQPPFFNEKVKGILPQLPGCNIPTSGPQRAVANTSCPYIPSQNPVVNMDGWKRIVPVPNNTTIGINGVGTALYRGCYLDATNGRAMNAASYTNYTGMTTESCAAFCASKGYATYGTEYASECYCSANLPTTSITNQTDCSMTCKGNLTQYCGGPTRLSVWTIVSTNSSAPSGTTTISLTKTTTLTLSSATSTPTSKSITYVSCYSDNGSSRTLEKSYNTTPNMTIDICASTAQSKNLAYFGLEFGSECWAGNTLLPSASNISSSSCNMRCTGDKTQVCGGSNALNIYKNDLFKQPGIVRNVSIAGPTAISKTNVTYVFQACYKEGTSGRALGTSGKNTSYSISISNMTVSYCASLCAARNYTYMGVEYASECYCNSVGVVNGGTNTGVVEGECNMLCAGDNTQWCGGGSRIAVYAVGSAGSSSGSGTANARTASSTTTTTSGKTAAKLKKRTVRGRGRVGRRHGHVHALAHDGVMEHEHT